MAAPSYASDLTNIIADMPNTTGWTLISTGGGGANSMIAPEEDYFIQGSSCISRNPFSSSIRGMVYNAGATTITSGNAVFFWCWAGVPNALGTEAAGGIQALIGSGTGALNAWYVRGSDTYAYGGWVCVPVDPAVATDTTIGSPTATRQFFGLRWNVPATGPARGNPFAIDAIRHGRTIQVVNGDSGGYGTFLGAAQTNDSTTNRWGLFQAIDGGYLQQGRFLMGTTGTAVDFRDANANIAIANTKKVTSTFNLFEVQNAASNVEWTNISISALGTTSRGNFTVTNNATVTKNGCVFSDMGTFTYQSNSSLDNTIYRRCQLVTQSSAPLTGCTFEEPVGAVALLSNNPAAVQDCTFVSDGTGHAIEITTAGTYTLSGNVFENYATTNGTTGNEVIYNNSGGAVTLNTSGGSGTVSYRNGTGASTTVVAGLTTITLTGLKSGSEVRVYTDSAGENDAEVAGIETSGTSFSFSASSGATINIMIHNLNYLRADIWGLVVPADATSIPISQFVDRNYGNPA